MLISVVIPLYNKAQYVGRAIDSVLMQGFRDYELIVVDDGSTDNSGEIVRSYKDPRIKYVQQKNAGECSARNRGIIESCGANIAFLDADDAWKDDFLGTISCLLGKYPDAGIYSAAYDVVDHQGTARKLRFAGISAPDWEGVVPDYFHAATLGAGPVCSSSVCIPRKVFSVAGLFPDGEKLGGDQDTWCRIALKFPVVFTSKVLATYYLNAENRVCANNPPLNELGFIKRLQGSLDRGMVPEDMRRSVRLYIAQQLLHLASINIKSGNNAAARKLLLDKRTYIFLKKRTFWILVSMLPRSVVLAVKRLRSMVYACYG